MLLFSTSGAFCGVGGVTHTLSHSPNIAGIFYLNGYGYAWYTNDVTKIGSYTVTVTATESFCCNTLIDTYTVNINCPCTLTSSLATGTSFTYLVNNPY